ncbi:MAG: M12 family metallo-peptidase [Candidatus Kapaibacterium sp.]|nr:MAG: M12 family metallo-peptidase [Candidatus Kapabacteria bacterium]
MNHLVILLCGILILQPSGIAKPLELTSFVMNSPESVSIPNFPVNETRVGTAVLSMHSSARNVHTRYLVATANGDSLIPAPTVDLYTGSFADMPSSTIRLVSVNKGKMILAFVEDGQGASLVIGPPIAGTASPEQPDLLVQPAFMPLPACAVSEIHENLPRTQGSTRTPKVLLEKPMLEAELAVETDVEFFKAAGGTVDAAAQYIAALYAVVSSFFEDETRITLSLVHVKIWTTNAPDPYQAKGDWTVLRDNAIPYWKEHNAAIHRDIYQSLTASKYGGGGFGYFDALCNTQGTGMSVASVTGTNLLPTYNFAYDSYIIAHELGHNFNAPHTHSCYWNPPIDTCVVADGIQDGCLPANQKILPNPGSFLSYCGGANNNAGLGYSVRMTFLPRVAALIRETAEAAPCIEPPSASKIWLLSPRGSESYAAEVNKTILVSWECTNDINTVSIRYSIRPGAPWVTLADNVPAALKMYQWTTPGELCSSKIRLLVCDASNPVTADTTKAPFAITVNDPSGLVAWYPLNATTADSALCGNYPATGAITYGADRNGTGNSAGVFQGATSLSVPDWDYPLHHFTISWWFKLNSLNGVQQFVGHDYTQGPGPAVYSWNGTLGAMMYVPGQSAPFQWWGPSLAVATWYHAAALFNGTEAQLFVNGKQVNNVAIPATMRISEAPLYIGSRQSSEYVNGMIDDIRIYNRALTTQEIEELFRTAVPDNVTENSRPANTLRVMVSASTADISVDSGEPISFVRVVNTVGQTVQTVTAESPEPFNTVSAEITTSGWYYIVVTTATGQVYSTDVVIGIR